MKNTKNIDVNPALKKFRKTNLYYTNNEMLLYQDPTYLGFKLFIEPGENGLFSTCIDGEKNTAYAYLMNIGQTERAGYIKKFNELFRKINNLTPWFFQELNGLEKAWDRKIESDEFVPKVPNEAEIEILCLESIDLRISTLIDLYRKACFDWEFRREIVPDNLRQFNISIYVYENRIINRTGLPLRTGMDAQSFLGLEPNKKQQAENAKLLGDDPYGIGKKKKLKDLLDSSLVAGKDALSGKKDSEFGTLSSSEVDTPNVNINRILFKFIKCKLLPDKSGEFLTGLKMSDGDTPIGQKIAFSYKNVTEENLNNIYSTDQKFIADAYNILDAMAMDKPNMLTELDGVSGDPYSTKSSAFGTIIDGLKSAGAEKLSGVVNNAVGKLLLGNVFGVSALDIANDIGKISSGDPNLALSGVVDLTKQGAKLGEKAMRSINKNRKKSLGNVFNK